MTDTPPRCPACHTDLRFAAFALCRRPDDGKDICRGVWACANRHVWWKWADRPTDPLEPCPYPDEFA